MSYIDNGSAQSLMQLGNLSTHLYTQLGVQVGKRLIHQEYLGVAHNGTAHRNTLTLSAGERSRLPIQKLLQIQDSCRLLYLFVNLLLGRFLNLQAECHIVPYGHMGIQRVALEYHCDITILRLHIVHQLSVNLELAGGNALQTCHHTQSCGLSAAGGSYENDKFLILDLQVEILYSLISVGVSLVNIL